jgi:hypothetical protein
MLNEGDIVAHWIDWAMKKTGWVIRQTWFEEFQLEFACFPNFHYEYSREFDVNRKDAIPCRSNPLSDWRPWHNLLQQSQILTATNKIRDLINYASWAVTESQQPSPDMHIMTLRRLTVCYPWYLNIWTNILILTGFFRFSPGPVFESSLGR